MKNQQRSCTICNTTFEWITKMGRPPATCGSVQCKDQTRRTRERYCARPDCDNKFSLDDAEAWKPYYCTETCMLMTKEGGVGCSYCSKPIPPNVQQYRNNFCSFECISAASEDIQCAVCGEPVEIPPSPPWFRVRKYCGPSCKDTAYRRGPERDTLSSFEKRQGDEEIIAFVKASQAQGTPMPTRRSGSPFLHITNKQIPANIQNQRKANIGMLNGLRFRLWQINELVKEEDPGPILQVLGMDRYIDPFTTAPVGINHPRYLPSLAQCFPYLPINIRDRLRRNRWVDFQQIYAQHTGDNRANISKWTAEVGQARTAIHSLEVDKKKTKSQLKREAQRLNAAPVSEVTLKYISLYNACQKLVSFTRPTPPEKYLPPLIAEQCDYLVRPSAENPEGEEGRIMQLSKDWMATYSYHDPDWALTPYPDAPPPPELPKKMVDLVIKPAEYGGTKKVSKVESNAPLLDYMLRATSISNVQFAYWFFNRNQADGFAKAWVAKKRDFEPDHD